MVGRGDYRSSRIEGFVVLWKESGNEIECVVRGRKIASPSGWILLLSNRCVLRNNGIDIGHRPTMRLHHCYPRI